VGPLARSAADLEAALEAMAGPDEIDSAGWRLALPRPRQERLADFRVAVLLDAPEAEVDRAVQDEIQKVADFLAKAGARVSDRARPEIDTGAAKRLFERLLLAAMSGRHPEELFRANLERARTLDPGDTSMAAQMARGGAMHHRDWLVANEERHRMRLRWAEFFRDWDLLLCPPVTTAAFPHDHEGSPMLRRITVNGRSVPIADQLFWAGYSGLFYLPATVAPAGLTPEGLPVGVQIVGPQYGDLACLRLARLLEREYRAFTPPPGY
jgi:amidase